MAKKDGRAIKAVPSLPPAADAEPAAKPTERHVLVMRMVQLIVVGYLAYIFFFQPRG